MDPCPFRAAVADTFRQNDPESKGKYRKKVMKGILYVALGKIDTKEQDISGLGIREYMSPVQIRIGIHQPAGNR